MANKKKGDELTKTLPLDRAIIPVYRVFSAEYIEAAFLFWYHRRHWGMRRVLEEMQFDEDGNKPSFKQINEWKTERGWLERADDIADQASIQINVDLINERIDMYRSQALMGKELQDWGMDYVRKSTPEGDAGAIRAIVEGVDMERVSRSMAESWEKIAKMTPEQLMKEINTLLGRNNTVETDFIDVTDEKV